MQTNNKNSIKTIKKKAEETYDRPESALIETEILHLPTGQEHVSKKTFFKRTESGHWEKITEVYPMTDSSGRYFYADMITGKSWTGHIIPMDHFASCKNPWHDHGYRIVYLKIDGHATETGNVLCSECYKKNKNRELLKKIFGWFYSPEIH
jgi:hypothetical protein